MSIAGDTHLVPVFLVVGIYKFSAVIDRPHAEGLYTYTE